MPVAKTQVSKPNCPNMHVLYNLYTLKLRIEWNCQDSPLLGKTGKLLKRALAFGVQMTVLEAYLEATGIRYPTISNYIQMEHHHA
jgi:hypothetical protein